MASELLGQRYRDDGAEIWTQRGGREVRLDRWLDRRVESEWGEWREILGPAGESLGGGVVELREGPCEVRRAEQGGEKSGRVLDADAVDRGVEESADEGEGFLDLLSRGGAEARSGGGEIGAGRMGDHEIEVMRRVGVDELEGVSDDVIRVYSVGKERWVGRGIEDVDRVGLVASAEEGVSDVAGELAGY